MKSIIHSALALTLIFGTFAPSIAEAGSPKGAHRGVRAVGVKQMRYSPRRTERLRRKVESRVQSNLREVKEGRASIARERRMQRRELQKAQEVARNRPYVRDDGRRIYYNRRTIQQLRRTARGEKKARAGSDTSNTFNRLSRHRYRRTEVPGEWK